MTRRGLSTTAIALVLSTSLLSSTLVADAASKTRAAADKVVAKVEDNAKLAPKYDPSQPKQVDEFAPNPNMQSVHFDFDRATIRSRDARILDSDARWLKQNQPYEVVIEGYADDRGTKPYNAALAKRRAMSVRNHLVARGIEPHRISMVSYGEARPECRTKNVKSEACWSKNRRADILVRHASAQVP